MSAPNPTGGEREFDALRRAQRAHEPSMEEILASIRAIIADDRAAEPAKPVAAPKPVRERRSADRLFQGFALASARRSRTRIHSPEDAERAAAGGRCASAVAWRRPPVEALAARRPEPEPQARQDPPPAPEDDS